MSSYTLPYWNPPPLNYWTEYAGRDNDEDPSTPSVVAAMRAFLEDNASPADTAVRLMSVKEAERPLYSRVGKENEIVFLIFDAMWVFPSQQERLLDLVDAIRAMNPEDMGWTEEQKARFPDWATWKELSQWHLHVDDCIRATEVFRFEPPGQDYDDPQWPPYKWARLNRMLALDCSRNTSTPCLAVDKIQRALEVAPWERAVQNEGLEHQIESLNIELPAAAYWLIYCGDHLYTCFARTIVGSYPNLMDKSDLYNGPPGFDQARLDFWIQRLESMLDVPQLTAENKELAKQAAASLKEVRARAYGN